MLYKYTKSLHALYRPPDVFGRRLWLSGVVGWGMIASAILFLTLKSEGVLVATLTPLETHTTPIKHTVVVALVVVVVVVVEVVVVETIVVVVVVVVV
ncbi:hypothetical protein ElyMa_004781900 [Elysia marginata]|uniref:Transmembrane protein n=1 Tax=Elysia marginata TaxID=1093978 RepID=A0AAV4ILR1_9GAST|nr:hypothetical protein ElyMa_004781900 [Elysia marginata]